MIRSVTITNPSNESLVLELSNPYDSGLAITSITGLGPNKADINSSRMASGSGSIFNGAAVASRNIVFNFQLLEDPETNMIETTRHRAYRYFPLMENVKIEIETDSRTVGIEGYVESVEPDIFNEKETIQVSVVCMTPWFIEDSIIDIDPSEIATYSGDVESGFTWTIEFNGDGLCESVSLIKDGEKVIINIKDVAEQSSRTLDLPSHMFYRKLGFVDYYPTSYYGNRHYIYFGITENEDNRDYNTSYVGYETGIGRIEIPSNIMNIMSQPIDDPGVSRYVAMVRYNEWSPFQCYPYSNSFPVTENPQLVRTDTFQQAYFSGYNEINGSNVWTDGENIYYSGYDAHGTMGQYIFNSGVWSTKIWNGLTDFSGPHIWSDGDNIYYSFGSGYNYILDKPTSTWSVKTWYGFDDLFGMYIWTDGTDIYYSDNSSQYVLDKSTSTWNIKTWNGFTPSSGFQIWSDGNNTYYSQGTGKQYVLDKTTSTWNVKTWNNFDAIYGSGIWSDDRTIYFGDSYVLDISTSTWSTKTWYNGPTSFTGADVWKDLNNDIIYVSQQSSDKQYKLPPKSVGDIVFYLSLGDYIDIDYNYSNPIFYKISEPTMSGHPNLYIEKSKIRDTRNDITHFDRDDMEDPHLAWGIQDRNPYYSEQQYVDSIHLHSNTRMVMDHEIPIWSYSSGTFDALYWCYRGQLLMAYLGLDNDFTHTQLYYTAEGKYGVTLLTNAIKDENGNNIQIDVRGGTVIESNYYNNRYYIFGTFQNPRAVYYLTGVPYAIYYDFSDNGIQYTRATSRENIPFDPGTGYCIVASENNEMHYFGGTSHYKYIEVSNTWEYVSTIPYDFRYGTAVYDNSENAFFLLGGDNNYTKLYMYKNGRWTMLHVASMINDDKIEVILENSKKKALLHRGNVTTDVTYAIDKSSKFPTLKNGNNQFTVTTKQDGTTSLPSISHEISYSNKFKGV